MTKLALVDVVRQLRVDLANAVAEAAGEMIQFEVGPIEAELSVEFEREGKVGGKITAWVVEFSGEAKMTETRGHPNRRAPSATLYVPRGNHRSRAHHIRSRRVAPVLRRSR